MDGKSLTPNEIKLNQLKDILPEAFCEGKIDWEKLKATLGGDINLSNERYVLNWADKSDAFRAMQTPTTKTLIPCPEESLKTDGTPYKNGETFFSSPDGGGREGASNIFIEGENLEVLKVLQKSYFGKVKMIYIDPPYNTGNDSFIYPDKFSETKEEYQKRVGDKTEEGYMTRDSIFPSSGGVSGSAGWGGSFPSSGGGRGWFKNSRENGQYHSNWLSMMYPRLFLARNLLRDDGVIFVSIDDNEVHNLRLLMNEVFGEENFIAQFIWKRRQNADSRNQSNVSIDHEYILSFGKRENIVFGGKEIDKTKYKNPDNDPRGPWASIDLSGLATADQRPNLHYDLIDPETGIAYPPNPKRGWSKSKSTIELLIKEGKILFPKNPEGRPREKKFLQDLGKSITGFSSWLDSNIVGFTTNGTREVTSLLEDKLFDFPKPTQLLTAFIKQITEDGDIILDFFAGSATTAHAVMELNKEDGGTRKYICVQLPEPCDEKSEAFKAGYKTIADIAKERIRRVARKLQAELDAEAEKKKGELQFSTSTGQGSQQGLDLGFKVLKLTNSNFKQWQQFPSTGGVSGTAGRGGQDAQALEEQMRLFIDPVAEQAKTENMVYELLLKSGKDLNSAIAYQNSVYFVNGNELALMLEKADQSIVDVVVQLCPKKVIALDRLFRGNDQLKTNTALQMKDAGVEFKTI